MKKQDSIIAVIPGRAGSKSIKNKSIALLGEQTLLERSICVARQVRKISQIIVSTDCKLIAKEAARLNVDVYARPAHLASDTALIADGIRDLLRTLNTKSIACDILVLLETTSMRKKEDIENTLSALDDPIVDSVATYCPVYTHPSKAWRIDDQGIPTPFNAGDNAFQNRQTLDPSWELNGACYAFRAKRLPSTGSQLVFGDSRAVRMPRERSIDINTSQDLLFAEFLLNKGVL